MKPKPTCGTSSAAQWFVVCRNFLLVLAVLLTGARANAQIPPDPEVILNALAGSCELQVAVASPSCLSAVDGEAQADVVGGNSDEYYYLWSNGEQGIAHRYVTGLAPGDYWVLAINTHEVEEINRLLQDYNYLPFITSNMDCRLLYKEFTISPSTVPVCPYDTSKTCTFTGGLTSLPSTCPISYDGRLTFDVSGGRPPYTIQWADGSNSRYRVVGPGYYEVTARDAWGQTLKGGILVSNGRDCINDPPVFDFIDAVVDVVFGLINALPIETIPIVGPPIDSLLNEEGEYNADCYTACRIVWQNPIDGSTTDGWIDYDHASNGNGPSYLWNDGTTNPSRSNVGTGVYAVTGRDNNCVSYAKVELLPGCVWWVDPFCDKTTRFKASGRFDPYPSGPGMCDGKAVVDITGGSGAFVYQWLQDPTNNTNEFNNACAIPYQVRIMDALYGCDTTIIISFDTLCTDPMDVRADVLQNPTFNNCDGQATVNVNGMPGPFMYQWSTGETTQQANNVCAGMTTVTVYKPFSNCVGVDTVWIGYSPCDSIVKYYGYPIDCDRDTICIPCDQLGIPPAECDSLCSWYSNNTDAVCISSDCRITCREIEERYGIDLPCENLPDTVCIPCDRWNLSPSECDAICSWVTYSGRVCKKGDCIGDPCDYLNATYGFNFDCDADTLCIPCEYMGLSDSECDDFCAAITASGRYCKKGNCGIDCHRINQIFGTNLPCPIVGDTVCVPCDELGLSTEQCDFICAYVTSTGAVCKRNDCPGLTCEELNAMYGLNIPCEEAPDTVCIPCDQLGLTTAQCDEACAVVTSMGAVCERGGCELTCEELNTMYGLNIPCEQVPDTICIPCDDLGLSPAECDDACAAVAAMGAVCQRGNCGPVDCEDLNETYGWSLDCSGDTVCIPCDQLGLSPQECDEACSVIEASGKVCVQNGCDFTCEGLNETFGMNLDCEGDTVCIPCDQLGLNTAQCDQVCAWVTASGRTCVREGCDITCEQLNEMYNLNIPCDTPADTVCVPCEEAGLTQQQCDLACAVVTSSGAVCVRGGCPTPCDSLNALYGLNIDCDADTVCIPCDQLGLSEEECDDLCADLTTSGQYCKRGDCGLLPCDSIYSVYGLTAGDTLCCEQEGLSASECEALCTMLAQTDCDVVCVDQCDDGPLPCDSLYATLGLVAGDTLCCDEMGYNATQCDSVCQALAALGCDDITCVDDCGDDGPVPCDSLYATLGLVAGDTLCCEEMGYNATQCDSVCQAFAAAGCDDIVCEERCSEDPVPCDSLYAELGLMAGDTLCCTQMGYNASECDSICQALAAQNCNDIVCVENCDDGPVPCDSLYTVFGLTAGDTLCCSDYGLTASQCDSVCQSFATAGCDDIVCVEDCGDDNPPIPCDSIYNTYGISSGDTICCNQIGLTASECEDFCKAMAEAECDITCINDCDEVVDPCDSLRAVIPAIQSENGKICCDQLGLTQSECDSLCNIARDCGIECVQDCDTTDCYLDVRTAGESCFGACDGEVRVNVVDPSGNSHPYYFMYSNGQHGLGLDRLRNLCAGVYEVVAIKWDIVQVSGTNISIDALQGCDVLTARFVIGTGEGLCDCNTDDDCRGFLSAKTSSASCYNVPDGAIDVDIYTGCPPYRIAWTDGSTAFQRRVYPGKYTATVADGGGFASTFSVWVSADNDCVSTGGEDNPTGIDAEVTIDVYDLYYQITGNTIPVNSRLYEQLQDSVDQVFEQNADAFCEQATRLDVTYPSTAIAFDGEIRYDVATNYGPQDYIWHDLETNNHRDSLPPGDYTVNSQDQRGCISQANVLMPAMCAENPEGDPCDDFMVEADFAEPSGFTACDGTIQLTISGGLGGYRIIWVEEPSNNGNDRLNNACYRSYTVQVSDTLAGCDTVLVVSPDSLYNCDNPEFRVRAYQIAPESQTAACDAMAKVDIYNGTGNYNIQWSNGDITDVADDLCGGVVYTVTVTDTIRNCTASDTVFIKTCLGRSRIKASVNVVPSYKTTAPCNGTATVVFDDPNEDPNDYFYDWTRYLTSDNNGAVPGANQNSGSGLCPGLYEVTIRAKGTSCDTTIRFVLPYDDPCTPENPLKVTIDEVPSSYPTVCDGQITANVTGGSGSYQYTWSSSSSIFPTNGNSINNVCGNTPIYLSVVDNDTGCRFDTSFTSSTCGRVSVDIRVTNAPDCPDSCNGSVLAVPFGMTEPLVYRWSDQLFRPRLGRPILTWFKTRPDRHNLCPGDVLWVEVRDRFGCVARHTNRYG